MIFNKIYKRKKIIIGFTVLIILVLGMKLSLREQYILMIQDKTSGKIIEYPLKNKKFSLGYTHSVMKTEAEEFFTTDENEKIRLVRTEYKSYGVGLPFLPEEGKMTIKDGKFILEINREFENISMVISPIGKHYLRINEKKYMLSEVLGNEPVKILLKINKKYKF